MGRRKIEMKKIEEKYRQHVTFSKRRCGVFSKASELCVVSGAQVAIFLLSPTGKVFTFGHPTVDAIIHRYRYHHHHQSSVDDDDHHHHHHHHQDLQQLRLLEAKRDHLKQIYKKRLEDKKNAWNKKFDAMGLEDLQKFKDAVDQHLKNKATTTMSSAANTFQQ